MCLVEMVVQLRAGDGLAHAAPLRQPLQRRVLVVAVGSSAARPLLAQRLHCRRRRQPPVRFAEPIPQRRLLQLHLLRCCPNGPRCGEGERRRQHPLLHHLEEDGELGLATVGRLLRQSNIPPPQS